VLRAASGHLFQCNKLPAALLPQLGPTPSSGQWRKAGRRVIAPATMDLQYEKVAPKQYPARAQRESREGRFWRSYGSQHLEQQFGAVSAIDFSPVAPYDFAISTSTRVSPGLERTDLSFNEDHPRKQLRIRVAGIRVRVWRWLVASACSDAFIDVRAQPGPSCCAQGALEPELAAIDFVPEASCCCDIRAPMSMVWL